jgi:hypothetical protein
MSNVVALPIGEAPGFEWRTRKNGQRVAYWIAPKKAVTAGFTPRTFKFSPDLSEHAIAQQCRRLSAEAAEWLSQEQRSIAPKFDGSVGSLIKVYQTEPLSKFSKVKWNTRHTYTKQFRLLDRMVGQRQLHALSARDFERWYSEFRKPAYPGGPERISRAHYLMTLFRMIITFGTKLEIAQCVRLRSVLSAMEFENSRPRTSLITYDMVKAFCIEARRSGRLSLALSTAIQFECALRQRDVIGEWQQCDDQAKAHGPAGKHWTTGLLWGEHIDRNLVMTKKTSKSRFIEQVEIDWKLCPLIMEQMQYVPPERRVGPVIVSEQTGLPYFPDAFCSNWRAIARRAGIADNVWNMDARSGAITEASTAGADDAHLRSLATHKSLKMTQRYNRPTLEKNTQVARLRVAHRQNKGT